MATINVLIAVDAVNLAEKVADGSISSGSITAPTFLSTHPVSDTYLTMIASNGLQDNFTNEQSCLQITANGGDTVEWAITTLDYNASKTAYVYAGNFNPPNSINTPLSFDSGATITYLPSGNPANTVPEKFINQVNTTSGTILVVSQTIQYTLSFTLVDNLNGKIIGHFFFDAFIVVN
jgi:hypothetical protein